MNCFAFLMTNNRIKLLKLQDFNNLIIRTSVDFSSLTSHKTPVSLVVILFEVTGARNYIIPIMLAATISKLLALHRFSALVSLKMPFQNCRSLVQRRNVRIKELHHIM